MPEQTKTGLTGSPDGRPVELLAISSPRRNASSCFGQLGLVVGHERQPVLEMRALHARRVADVAQRGRPEAALVAKRIQIRLRQIGQRRRAARGERQHPGAAVVALVRAATATSAAGAASRMACPLVPPKPKELTAARAGCPLVSGQGSSCCATRSRRSSNGICGFGFSKCRFLGIWRCFRHRAALINPATPAPLPGDRDWS